MNEREYLWAEKYRPHTVEDCILPSAIKANFQAFVDSGNVPNLILAGGPGRGKTSVAKAMLEEIGCSYYLVNGPLEVNLDMLRNDIASFASSMALNGKRKYVIIDEADYLNPHVQPSLRTFIEEYASTCGFIFTCNFKDKIMEAISSRCPVIDFSFGKNEAADLAKQLLLRVFKILDAENVTYDKKVVVELVKKYYPDFRRVINELQRYAVGSNDNIDAGILVSFDNTALKQLIELMKNKEFTAIRKWVNDSDYEEIELYKKLYETATDYITTESIPQLVLLLAKYQYQSAFAADKQINLLAFLVEAMVELEFK